jgi:hypothetical protein
MPLTAKNTKDFVLVINKLLFGIYYYILRREYIYREKNKTMPVCVTDGLSANNTGDFRNGEEVNGMKFSLREIISPRLLCVGFICGIAGMMVDLDHVPNKVFNMHVNAIYLIKNFYTDSLQMGWGRPMHNLVLVLALMTFMCIMTLLFQYNVRIFAARSVDACKRAIASIAVDQ